jgi:GNAT superfamily N-acetyltransferase
MPEPLRVRRLGEADADSIAEFLRAAAWDPDATPERVRETFRTAAANNPFEPGQEPPTVGVFIGARLVAYLTAIPTRFWNGKQSAAAHWLKGFWVLEPYRNGPIGYLLLKEMLKHVGLAASMPAALVPRRLSAALGMLDLGAVCNYIEPLRPARILQKLDFERYFNRLPGAALLAVKIVKIPPVAYAVGALVTLGLRGLRLPSALAGRSLRAELSERLPSEAALDGLWARAQRALRSAAVRSGAYLRWRYERDSNGRYCFASVWRGNELMGLTVLQHPERLDDPRIAGLGIGSVVDLVLDPQCPGALPAVLAVARRWARSANYDALLLTASNRGLRAPLLRSGYVPTPGNIHVLLRDPGARHGLSTDLNAWMVTRGDAWSDHL